MNKMGCGCDLGCKCELGCGCDVGCSSCQSKSTLGQIERATGMNPWWFLAGAAVGAGLWYFVSRPKAAAPKPSTAGQEKVAAMPSVTSPNGYVSLDAVLARLKDIEQLYPASISPEQALVESDKLKDAANAFSLQDGEGVGAVLAEIDDFQARVRDFIQFKKDNPGIPQYQPSGIPVVNTGFTARA